MGPADSTGIPRVPAYSGCLPHQTPLTGTGLSPPAVRRSMRFPFVSSDVCAGPYNPAGASTPAVWALPRSIASTGGIVFTFSSCGYWDVSVPRVRLRSDRMSGSLPTGCPIRISAHQGIFAPPRGFSQLVTSFFASESQGILHAPFLLRCFSCGPCLPDLPGDTVQFVFSGIDPEVNAREVFCSSGSHKIVVLLCLLCLI